MAVAAGIDVHVIVRLEVPLEVREITNRGRRCQIAAEQRVTDGVVSRDLHEVVVEDPETRPGSGTTAAADAGAVHTRTPSRW